MRKIYMFDDHRYKQFWFLKIVNYLNNLDSKDRFGMQFCSGFGEDIAVAQEHSRNPGKLWEALQDQEAIYLVDLDLQTGDQSLRDYFEGAASDHIKNLAVLLDSTKDEFDFKNDHLLSISTLLYCREMNKPAMLVSTETTTTYVNNVIEADLTRIRYDGFPNFQDLPRNMLEETLLDRWAKRILALLDPLEHIESITQNWFAQGPNWSGFEHDGLPHELPEKYEPSEFKACVRRAFSWIPANSKWFENDQILAFHECLKRSVGYHAIWPRTGSTDKRYPLCLGGVFLLFMIAVEQRFPGNAAELAKNINWNNFIINGIPKSFSPKQEPDDAFRHVRSLFEFFIELSVNKNTGTLAITSITSPNPGDGYFYIQLNWTAQQVTGFSQTLKNGFVSLAFETNTLQLPQGKLVGQYLRSVIAAQVRSSGFGSNGQISMSDKAVLKIGK